MLTQPRRSATTKTIEESQMAIAYSDMNHETWLYPAKCAIAARVPMMRSAIAPMVTTSPGTQEVVKLIG